MQIGPSFKMIRIIRKKKQCEVALLAEISAPYLSQVEKGIQQPSLLLSERLCKIYGVPLPIVILLATEEADFPNNKKGLYLDIKGFSHKILQECLS